MENTGNLKKKETSIYSLIRQFRIKREMHKFYNNEIYNVYDNELEILNKYFLFERRLITEAYEAANTEIHNEDGSFKTGEQYFNETYKKI